MSEVINGIAISNEKRTLCGKLSLFLPYMVKIEITFSGEI